MTETVPGRDNGLPTPEWLWVWRPSGLQWDDIVSASHGYRPGDGREVVKYVPATALEAAQSEAAFYRAAGIAEIAAVNPRVMEYMTHWEGRVEAAQARIVELQDKVLLAYNLARKAEDFRKTARREALEAAVKVAENHLPKDMWEARDSTTEYNTACRDIAKAIRALMEKPNDQP